MENDDQATTEPEVDVADSSGTAEVGSDGTGHAEEAAPHAQDVAVDGAEDILQPDTTPVERVAVDDEAAPDEVEAIDDAPVASDNDALLAVSLAQVGAASAAMLNLPVGEESPVEVAPVDDDPTEGCIELIRMPNGRPVLLSRAALDVTTLSQLLLAVADIVRKTVLEYNSTKKEDAFLPVVINDAHYLKSAAEIATRLWNGQNLKVLNLEAADAPLVTEGVIVDASMIVAHLCKRPDLEVKAATIRVALQTGGSIPYAMTAVLRYLDSVAEIDGDTTPVTDMLAARLSI